MSDSHKKRPKSSQRKRHKKDSAPSTNELDDTFTKESSSQASDEHGMEVDDDISKQLKKEKANALHIIDSILGKNSTPARHGQVTNTLMNPVELFPTRYDPEAVNHDELEQSTPRATGLKDNLISEDESSESDSEHDDNVPSGAQELEEQQSTEKYFTVNRDLKELFSSTNTSEGFRFFDDSPGGDPAQDDDDDDDDDDGKTTEDLTAATPQKHHKKHKESSEHQEKLSVEDTETTSRERVLFFFHADSPTLRNRLDENTFYRTKSMKELELNWAVKRTTMKECFRKRRKEAMKHSKKN